MQFRIFTANDKTEFDFLAEVRQASLFPVYSMRCSLLDGRLILKCAYAVNVEEKITYLTFFCGSEETTGTRPVDFRFRGRPGPRRAGLRGVSSFLEGVVWSII